MTIPGKEKFQGTERFAIQRRLGSGGFGVVYRAYDRRRNTFVALKTLHDLDASALYRFKREFRAMADVTHPNLVTLYELISEGDLWFFTMELIEGVNLLDYVRQENYPALPDSDQVSDSAEQPTVDAATWPSDETLTHRPGLDRMDALVVEKPSAVTSASMDRVRHAFRQLAEGICVLHQAGMLHRDIKPSNVLVTREGRVVLLDFGLVADLAARDFGHSLNIVGTPQYMSPEQAAGAAVTEASDWYSVGIMLYEALTGHPPFTGTFPEVILKKQTAEPPLPGKWAARLPEALDALCQDLLRRDPQARPSGRQVLERLGVVTAGAQLLLPGELLPSRSVPLIGREPHLRALRDAFEAVREGRTVSVCVYGRSGMGKTALVRRFLRELRQHERETVVLRGRCYDRESVPYKALDSLVDALSEYLKRLPPLEAERVLPRDMLALARLFPVLREVGELATARARVLGIPDSQELRRRAFAALRELLARLADRKPLLLFIDDLQWGDADSAALLADLLRPPNPPILGLLVSYRSEEADTSPVLRSFLQSLQAARGDVRRLEVGELSQGEARELAVALLGEAEPSLLSRAEAIARESGGNPLFANELVRYASAASESGRSEIGPTETTLAEVIQARVSRLPEKARRLVEVVAVAGQPIHLEAARRAAGLDQDDHSIMAFLSSSHLVRSRGTPERAQLETYHDRIRENVVDHLSPETLKAHHRHLGEALETSEAADPETLAVHFQGAGDLEKAAHYAVRAAAQAAEALAFDRAARLYRLALDLRPPERAEACALSTKLGDALANAGRGPEAAHAYLAAAEGAGGSEAVDLKRRAAEQLLVCGHIDEGLDVLRTVLGAVGMRMPETPRRSLLSLLARRALLAVRGLDFREREPRQIRSLDLMRIDTCWSGVIGFSMVNTIRGADFQARHLLLALRAGEPYRVARALGMEIGYAAQPGAHTTRRTQEIIQTTLALAERVENPHALGVAMANMGAAAFLQGDYTKGLELSERAEAILRERCTGVTWELDTSQTFLLDSLYWTGAWDEMFRRMPILAKEAQDRGDLLFGSYQRRLHLIYLAADQPVQAREEVHRRTWSQQGFHIQHYMDLITHTEIDLYTGDALGALKRVTEQWPGLTRSLLTRVQFIRAETRHLHARAALAIAAAKAESGEADAERYLTMAERDAAQLEREKTAWTGGLAALIRAGAAATRRSAATALPLTAAAEKECEAAHMAHYAAVARRRRGELLGGADGQVLIETAEAWMSRQKIANRERMTAMLAPGNWAR